MDDTFGQKWRSQDVERSIIVGTGKSGLVQEIRSGGNQRSKRGPVPLLRQSSLWITGDHESGKGGGLCRRKYASRKEMDETKPLQGEGGVSAARIRGSQTAQGICQEASPPNRRILLLHPTRPVKHRQFSTQNSPTKPFPGPKLDSQAKRCAFEANGIQPRYKGRANLSVETCFTSEIRHAREPSPQQDHCLQTSTALHPVISLWLGTLLFR